MTRVSAPPPVSDALADPDDRIRQAPRNHWLRLDLLLQALAAGRVEEAWRRFEALTQSGQLGPDVLGPVRGMIAQALAGAPPLRLDLPADYHRLLPGKPFQTRLAALAGPGGRPAAFPPDMVLPPLTGDGNDFTFIADAARSWAFTPARPDLRLHLVLQVAEAADLQALAAGLAVQTWPADRCRITVFAPAGLHGRALPPGTQWREGRVQAADAASLAEGAEGLVFLSGGTRPDPLLLERVARHLALSSRLWLAFVPVGNFQGAEPQYRPTILSDGVIHGAWSGDRFPHRRCRSLNFAAPAALFRRLGGFDPRFQGAERGVAELAFRATQAGAWIMPMAVNGPVAQPGPDDSPAADQLLFAGLCPADRRGGELRHEVPKVSIYIPAYKAERYLRDAIDSVLGQDYADLEICVADDGSPDATRAVLESYGAEPRLRWVSNRNGGIGFASNSAIRLARGQYIGQLDSDDRLKPGAVRRLADYLDEHPKIGCVYSSCERIDAAGNYLHDEYSFPEFSREKMMLTSIAHHFRMFRRQVWERTETFREDIVNAVDYDMFLKMSEVARFHHIEEMLYQRRWHGENTSSVNEAFQSTNTHVVQRKALDRLGLDTAWDVHVPDPEKPREVTYRRRAPGDRVFFWPDYSRANPYQRLLYAKARAREDGPEFIGAPIDAALAAAEAVEPGAPGQIVFHLHWLNKVMEKARTAGDAAAAAEEFLAKLRRFRFLGGRLVWTIHNIVSHDLPFPWIETAMAREIVALADAVHIHSLASLPEIEAQFAIPRDKLHVAPHGSYLGAYPDFIGRAVARDLLGIAASDEVILFLGQVRPYKGLEPLLGAFRGLLAERPRARLVLAGQGRREALLQAVDLEPEVQARVTHVNRFIDEMELQLFFRAADVAAFPYRSILTSGSLLMALSFGVPVVIPEFGMTREVLAGSGAGVLYGAAGGADALAGALQQIWVRGDAGQFPAMAAAARRRAADYDWADLSAVLLGGGSGGGFGR